jgi:hypothetical protein
MSFKVSRLRNGDRLVALGAVALLVVMFFCKWFGVQVPALISAFVAATHASTSADAWHTLETIRWLLLLTAIVSLALVVLRAVGITSTPLSAAVAALGVLSSGLVLYRVLISHPFAHAEVKIGAWLGLAACALIAVGGYLAATDEGDALAELARAQAHSETPAAPL